jgi:DNA-directed RNA polymerase specialized sigma24 family protein
VVVAGERCEGFLAREKGNLARAFAASFGIERGQEALAEAMAYAWEHWEKVEAMQNPVGYLYRVGQSRSRASRRRHVVFPTVAEVGTPWVEPGLPGALSKLTNRQRAAVVLAHGYGWSHGEIAELLGTKPTTVQTHIDRGVRKLRAVLGVTADD